MIYGIRYIYICNRFSSPCFPKPTILFYQMYGKSDKHLLNCLYFCSRDRYGISTKRDRILCIFMIVLAVFSNLVAIYSDAYALIKKNSAPREWFLVCLCNRGSGSISCTPLWRSGEGGMILVREWCFSLKLLESHFNKCINTAILQNLSSFAQHVSKHGSTFLYTISSGSLSYIDDDV